MAGDKPSQAFPRALFCACVPRTALLATTVDHILSSSRGRLAPWLKETALFLRSVFVTPRFRRCLFSAVRRPKEFFATVDVEDKEQSTSRALAAKCNRYEPPASSNGGREGAIIGCRLHPPPAATGMHRNGDEISRSMIGFTATTCCCS